MKRTRRVIFATAALIAGVGLVAFEVMHRRTTSSGELGFWLVVGAALIFFALLDLLSNPPDRS